MGNPLNSKWSLFAANVKGGAKDDYTWAEICYGTNDNGDGPKDRVCTIQIPNWYPVEVRKEIIKRLSGANDHFINQQTHAKTIL